ncbi:SRPBCC domain-containing protein [Chryseobacterium sp. Alg-005]|uniref:SRPBCC family protein n=1 Tax=Chryseobacterium sp. Alg-005 TaxID=3159516 RepID=UPI0035556F39
MSVPIIVEYKVNAPIEKVWKALTDKKEMQSWYFDIPDFELREGNEFNFYETGEEKKYHHRCEILEIIPEQTLKHSWAYPEFSKEKTIVTWEIIPEDDGTLIRLIHEGIEKFRELGETFSRNSFTAGWNEIIGKSLKTYLEK